MYICISFGHSLVDLLTAHCHVGRFIDQFEFGRITGHLAPIRTGRMDIQFLQFDIADELIAVR